jgi:hypothetical protein
MSSPLLRFLARVSAALSLACAITPFATAGELKVDINNVSRNQVQQTEAGYTMWSSIIPSGNPGTTTTGLAAATQTFTTSTGELVTISFAQTALSQSRGGTGIIANWFQVGAQGVTKLVSDGIGVGPVATVAGGEIRMTLTGLSAGDHTLLVYLNAVDNPATNFFGPIDISVNGALVIDNLQPTIRAASTLAAATAYLEFAVGGPSDVVTILFTAEPSPAVVLPPGTTLRRTPFINGFEIDTPNFSRIANTPFPADFDEHADADTGGLTLSWESAIAGGIVSHDVYFGTDLAAVKNATRSSPEFKGNQTARTFPVTGLSTHLTYYWRIDEINTLGNTTKGSTWYFRTRQLAFPGAEGYGRFARGGRGGKVVHVTSLADTSTPGTLRYAIEQETGPRTIVFDVGGLITLDSRLVLNQPYVTVAGQTAPGKGITVRKYTLGLSGARDNVVRFMRSRPGNISGTTIDGMGMQGSDHSIMDHCSVSWSLDEAFSSRSARNITLQRTLVSEALNSAGHANYPPGTEHGYAASIGGDKGSFHHNLLAHNYGRNWSLAGGLDGSGFFSGRLDITNNVVYNWGNRTSDGGAMEVNFVNNYYQPGAGTTHFFALTMQHENAANGSQRAYFAGNVMPGRFDETTQTLGRRSIVSSGVPPLTYETFVDAPFFPSFVTTQTAGDAYKRVLSDVGANAPLDDHDSRIINETLTGTFSYRGSVTNKPGFPDSENDVGGWEDYPEIHRPAEWDTDKDGLPNWWETLKGLNPNSPAGSFADANADLDGDGYNNLDDYLHWLSLPRAECPYERSIDINLGLLTRGYTASPIHSLGVVTHGSATLLADGKTARFTPAAGFFGLAELSFSVIDSAGSSMTRTVAIRVLEPIVPRNYAAWAAAYGLTGVNFDPGADPEGDSVVNQLEFILGLNPLVADSEDQPAGALESGAFVFRLVHDRSADAAFAIEHSLDLLNWSPVAGTLELSFGHSEVLAAQSTTAPERKQFFRLTSGGFSTTPVGYLTTALMGAGKTTAFGLLFDGTAVNPPGLRAGKIDSLTANSLTALNGDWTTNLADPAKPWAVRILSGAAEGALLYIHNNTSTTLTLAGSDLLTAGAIAGDRFELIPLDTLHTFFGSSLLQGGTSASLADVVQLRSGTSWFAYYYDTALGFWRRTIGPATNCNNVLIRPASGITILRRGATLNLSVAGRVLGTTFRAPINNASTTGITAGYPTDTTLSDLSLQTLLAGWRSGTTGTTADSVALHNGTTWVSYLFNGTEWRTTTGVNGDSVSIPAGAVLLIQRPGGAAGTTDLIRAKTY